MTTALDKATARSYRAAPRGAHPSGSRWIELQAPPPQYFSHPRADQMAPKVPVRTLSERTRSRAIESYARSREIQESASPCTSLIAQRNYLRRFLPASVGFSMLSRPLKTASVKGPAPTEFNTLGGHLGFRCNR